MATFFDLVRSALPEDVSLQEILPLSPKAWWQEKPYLASAHALRKCARINWDAYLAQYPDIGTAGMDACLHFLRHGIYEGRKLKSWHPLKQAEKSDAPLVSIVLINYNNAHLLEKCIGSVLSQTLANLELIVVDDCSTDNSLAIIRNFASIDPRVKVLVNEQNSATLITRKRGVEAATGRYLMFLDSDDYLAPNACETAVKAISQGYDMVKFGADVINSLNAPQAVIMDASDFCNRGENCEYFNDQIITNIFRDGKISWHVWSYIYLREIVAAAFAELPSEYATGPDDLYALLATARQARNLRKIADRLLFYNFGPGVSATYDKAKVLKYAPAIANTICAVRRYAENYSLNIGLTHLYPNLCGDLLERLLPAGSDADLAACFNQLTERLGFRYVLESLLTRHHRHYEKIAELIQPLASAQTDQEITHIGIFFPRLHYGGAESMIKSLAGSLTQAGYQITIFEEDKSERIMPLPAGVNQVYIGDAGTSKSQLLERLRNLEQAARESGINLMIHVATNEPYLLWDLMVMRHLQIPMIFLHRFNFAWSFSELGAKLRQGMEAAFRSADAVICMSRADELYLRLEGINAVYLPPAIRQHEYHERHQVPQAIAVLGRLGDPVKQVGDSLKIMQRIVSRAPWVTLYLIGDFYTQEQRDEFQRILQEYGLVKNVILTGLTEKPDQFLQKCGVLLSVSALESFPMNIAEAQALGLPCVIYDVPIEIERDNPSIISVPQGDVAAASATILELLENEAKWRALSHIAAENTRQFAPELIRSKLTQLLNNLHNSSPIKPKNTDDYETIIKYSGKYSGKRFREKWQDVVKINTMHIQEGPKDAIKM